MQRFAQSMTDWLRNGLAPHVAVLIGVMAPSLMVGMDHHMFGVALPNVRASFNLDADMVAWASMVYSLPFMTLMPLYGRLGDGLGKRRLLMVGISVFLFGTMVLLLAPSLPWYMVGRAIQGVGTAGFVPLSIALIAQWFPPSERGRVMGTWNSIVPLSGLVFPYFGGLLVDAFGWRAIYPAIVVVGVVALVVVKQSIPTVGTQVVPPHFLRRFDWLGVGLLTGALVSLLFYTSSRPITGVEGLRDWRLLTLCLLLFALFIGWERRRPNPYMNLAVFTNRTFTAASFCAGLRMFMMSSSSFLLPLYLTDIHGLRASTIGIALALQAGMLFLTSQAGGQVADRWGSRWPVVISMGGMVGILVLLALAGADTPVGWLYVLAGAHGLTIGLSLAPLHRSSMQDVAEREAGAAAGLYSMIRFAGQILGVAVAGVVLQQQLTQVATPVQAYQFVLWLYVAVAILATSLGLLIRET
ncbi:MAG: MFS transporter [Caldilineaceae bacterium]|nr:MFS transporter [Caldilineaceae bacterium]